MESLFLTKEESKKFAQLSDALREGWAVESQGAMKEEKQEQLILRYKMAHFDDPYLKQLMSGIQPPVIRESLMNVVHSVDIGKLSIEQLSELFFVLGIGVMSDMILALLKTATTDEDLEGVAGLTHIRSALHEANSSHS